MSKSIPQIPVKGNIDYIALQKVCDDLLSARKVVLRVLEDVRRASEGYSNHTTSTPLLDMDELRVRYWLRGQDGFVTSREVAETLFTSRPASAGLSMSMAKYLNAAGWRPVKKVQGTKHWTRGASAERVS